MKSAEENGADRLLDVPLRVGRRLGKCLRVHPRHFGRQESSGDLRSHADPKQQSQAKGKVDRQSDIGSLRLPARRRPEASGTPARKRRGQDRGPRGESRGRKAEGAPAVSGESDRTSAAPGDGSVPATRAPPRPASDHRHRAIRLRSRWTLSSRSLTSIQSSTSSNSRGSPRPTSKVRSNRASGSAAQVSRRRRARGNAHLTPLVPEEVDEALLEVVPKFARSTSSTPKEVRAPRSTWAYPSDGSWVRLQSRCRDQLRLGAERGLAGPSHACPGPGRRRRRA